MVKKQRNNLFSRRIEELNNENFKVIEFDQFKNEADVLNVALFGMTAKEWREDNPKLAKNGNMRDYTDLLHLIILNNLENTHAELIRMNIKQSDRLIRLNESARNQMEALKNNKNIKELEVLQQQINEDNKYLI